MQQARLDRRSSGKKSPALHDSCITDLAFATVATAFFGLVNDPDTTQVNGLARSLYRFIQTWKDIIIKLRITPSENVDEQPIFNTIPDAIVSTCKSIIALAGSPSAKMVPTYDVCKLVYEFRDLHDKIVATKKRPSTSDKAVETFLCKCEEWIGERAPEKPEKELDISESVIAVDDLPTLAAAPASPQALEFSAIVETAMVRGLLWYPHIC